MKKIFTTLLLSLFLVGCTTNEKVVVDPVSAGEVIGYTYLLTKDQLKEQDRQAIIIAYEVFTYVVNLNQTSAGTDLKEEIFALLDEKFLKEEDEQKKAAIKAVVTVYWSRIQTKYNIEQMDPTEQLEVLRQVHIGIERALGH